MRKPNSEWKAVSTLIIGKRKQIEFVDVKAEIDDFLFCLKREFFVSDKNLDCLKSLKNQLDFAVEIDVLRSPEVYFPVQWLVQVESLVLKQFDLYKGIDSVRFTHFI